MSNIYIGLDLSLTATGFAVVNEAGTPVSIGTYKSPKRGPARLLDIAQFCYRLLDQWTPDVIAIEAPISHGAWNIIPGAMLHGALQAVLTENARFRNLYYVATTTLKKFVTGSGRGEKGVIQMHVLKKWGQALDDNNQADAYGLARVAGAIHGGLKSHLTYEKECIGVVKQSSLNAEMLDMEMPANV